VTLQKPVATAARREDGSILVEWSAVPDAAEYWVFADGRGIGVTLMTSLVDMLAPDSAVTYKVEARFPTTVSDPVTVPAVTSPPIPGVGPSGIAPPLVKAGWKLAPNGFNDFDDTIPFGSWSGDPQGTMMGRASGEDTSKRGKYSNKEVSQHDSVLDSRSRMVNGQRWMGCPMNKTPNPSNSGSTAPKALRVTVCLKIDGPEAGWKIAYMMAKYGAVRLQEFDWPEVSLKVGAIPNAWLHMLNGGGGKHFVPPPPNSLYEWHTYTPEVVAGKYAEVYFDGKLFGRAEGASLIGTNGMHYIVQNETMIGGTLPANMGEAHSLIDWVQIEVPA
jgi:hypothetical protein